MGGQGNETVKSDAEVTTHEVMAEQLHHQHLYSALQFAKEIGSPGEQGRDEQMQFIRMTQSTLRGG